MYDSDGDGVVSADDMELMLRQLAGSTLRSDIPFFTSSVGHLVVCLSTYTVNCDAPCFNS